MTPLIAIQTPRCRLRPVTTADAAAIAGYLADWDVVRWLARPPHPYTLADAEAFIASLARSRAPGELTLAIETDGQMAGLVGLDRRKSGMVLGYWLGQPFWGRGLMTEAATALVRQHFNHADLDQVPDATLQSGYFAGNQASARVLAKLGFEPTGHGAIMNIPQGREMAHIEMRLVRWRFQALFP